MPKTAHALLVSVSVSVGVSAVLAGCGSPAPSQSPVAPAASGGEPSPVVAPPTVSDGAARADASPASASPAEPTVETARLAAFFPPPKVTPPSAKSAVPGDGEWTPFGDSTKGEHLGDEKSVYRTVLHPHPNSRYVAVTIAAVDLSRVRLTLVPGTEDLAWAKLPTDGASGLVPQDQQNDVLFVMNGGFQPKHGKWGLMSGSAIVTEPRPDGCTVALYQDGTAKIALWPKLAESRPQMAAYRQTPPCLVDGGEVHPQLVKGNDKAWAGHVADVKTQRRSAVGIDASGRVLFYALGEEAEPRHLADALRAAGAFAAAELDINWYWTRFLAIGTVNGERRVTSPLVPKMEYQPSSYTKRASTRDFFYAVPRKAGE